MSYLESAKKQFLYYKSLGDRTFQQVPDASLLWQYNQESNSISTIVKHLWGNMLSRWTEFLTTDGEKPTRDREGEFENDIATREEMMAKWNAGWDCLFIALNELTDDDLVKTIYIRNQGHSVQDAINRQLAHYSYHIGQIVFIGKLVSDKRWLSLSIPKGESKIFNKDKFSQPKRIEHFTDTLNLKTADTPKKRRNKN
jgi:hypothetical protein